MKRSTLLSCPCVEYEAIASQHIMLIFNLNQLQKITGPVWEKGFIKQQFGFLTE